MDLVRGQINGTTMSSWNATALVHVAQRAAATLPPAVRSGVLGVWRLLLSAAVATILVPLKGLYLYGPTLGGYGFWGGTEPADICAQLTGVSAGVWASNPETALQCDALVERRFTAFVWAVFFSAYAYALYNLASHAWYRYVSLPAQADAVRRVLEGVDGHILVRPKRRSRHHHHHHHHNAEGGSSSGHSSDEPQRWRRRHLVAHPPTPPRPRPSPKTPPQS